ncbi:unnamed protein product [Urochloa humidicola]
MELQGSWPSSPSGDARRICWAPAAVLPAILALARPAAPRHHIVSTFQSQGEGKGVELDSPHASADEKGCREVLADVF